MTTGEIAYLSTAVGGFVLFAAVLFTVERIQSRQLRQSSHLCKQQRLSAPTDALESQPGTNQPQPDGTGTAAR